MTDYIPFTPEEYAPEAPATDLHFQRWFTNWIAANEGAAGAPYNHFDWHPYNGSAWGDGATGNIWSMAANGAVSVVTTPNFLDGFQYAFEIAGIRSTVASAALRINPFRETSGAYAGVRTITGFFSNTQTTFHRGYLFCVNPRQTNHRHYFERESLFRGVVSGNMAGAFGDGWSGTWQHTGDPANEDFSLKACFDLQHSVAQKLLNLQFTMSSGNITGLTGAYIRMFRKRFTL